jgi:pyruvate/2-oxoglutarate dehydrogenase complex dihydrolipoamide acyltransferase (E2) component
MRDGLHVADAPGFSITLEVNMTSVMNNIECSKSQTGVHLTPIHFLIKAIAHVAIQQEIYRKIVSDTYTTEYPHVDIGVSIDAGSIIAPVYVIRHCEVKSLSAIAEELFHKKPEVIEAHQKFLSFTKKWGWLIPFQSLRRLYLRRALSKTTTIHRNVGLFQVTVLKDVDIVMPLIFAAPIIISMGKIKKRPIVIDNNIIAISTAFLTICANHKNWEGLKASNFANQLKEFLESNSHKN